LLLSFTPFKEDIALRLCRWIFGQGQCIGPDLRPQCLTAVCTEDKRRKAATLLTPLRVCLAGVPQGSVLDPLLFSIYIAPIAHIAQAHGIQQQQYADDTQLYVALSPNSMVTHVFALESCLESLQSWFCANSMTLNADKYNAINHLCHRSTSPVSAKD